MKVALIRSGLAVVGLGMISASASAQSVNFTLFSSSYTGGFDSFARDQTTGNYYNRLSYTGNSLTEYNNEAQFASNSVVSTSTLAGGGYYGTYDAVINGKVYGRTDNSTTAIGRWDAATGALDATRSSVANMGGANGSDSFDWGGYSGPNFFNNGNSLYLFGHNPSGNWTLDQMSLDLQTILSSQTVTAGTLGCAFDINGHLFLGPSYASNTIVSRFDIASSSQQSVNFTIDGIGNVYLSEMYYDGLSDSLFAFNSNTSQWFVTRNAASQFGVSTPEPASLAVLALGALALLRRRRS